MVLKITELIRSIIWGLMSCVLNIIDILWEAAKLICGLDLSNDGLSWIWDYFTIIEVFFLLFLVFRIIKIVFKAFTDDEFMQKINPSQWLMKMACAVVIMSAVPYTIKEMSGLVNSLVTNIGDFSADTNMQNSQQVSSLLVDSSSIDLTNNDINSETLDMKEYISQQIEDFVSVSAMSKSEFKDLVSLFPAEAVKELVPSINKEGNKLTNAEFNKVYQAYIDKLNDEVTGQVSENNYWYSNDINDIDINEGIEDSSAVDQFVNTISFGFLGDVEKVYYMYPTWSSLFFGVVTIIAVALIFIPILIQMAQRMVSLIIKLFLAPYAVSSLVDPESNTFSVWCKYMASDLIANFFQLYSMMILFALMGNSTLDSMLKSTTIVGTIAKIAIIIGGLLAVYATPSGVTAIIGGSEMSAANTLMQMQALLAGGRAIAGIASIGTGLAKAGLSSVGEKIGNGFSGGINGGSGGSGAAGADGFGGNADGTLDGLTPNQEQQEYASSLGIDPSGMNRGQLASAIADAGGSAAVFEMYGQGDSASTGSQLDYADSFGIDGTGMTNAELASAIVGAGGSATVFDMLSGDNGIPASNQQIKYANSLGIKNAGAMSRSQLGNAVVQAGGNQKLYNRYGGITGTQEIRATQRSVMNTKIFDRINRSDSSIGDFTKSKAAQMQANGF